MLGSVDLADSNWFGLDTSNYSFVYIASWSTGKKISELRASLNIVRLASHGIIDGIEEQTLGTRKPGEREREEMGRTLRRGTRHLVPRPLRAEPPRGPSIQADRMRKLRDIVRFVSSP